MSQAKLCFFTMLAVIVAFAAVVKVTRGVEESDVPKPSMRLHGPVLASDGPASYRDQTTENLGGSNLVKAFRSGSESLSTIFLPVQTKNAKDLGAGKLLVASRSLGDPHFVQTVVLLLHYDAQAVFGLILNRRTDVPMSRALEDLKAAKDRSDPVYVGGPVEAQALFALFQSPTNIEGAKQIFDGVYLISPKALLEQPTSRRPDPGVFHVYLGCAAWTMDQLRKEVELGAWFIFPADANTVFSATPDSVWSQMIQKTELKMAGIEPADAWTGASPVVKLSYKL
jgi:putative transcriptional regulator